MKYIRYEITLLVPSHFHTEDDYTEMNKIESWKKAHLFLLRNKIDEML